ncbi:Putative_RNA polymerase I specific transcription initiation factor RRN3 family protein [Hexamita inflata]|uniref:RNA polymerase I specific transcription initiation factor RRN3 family protein n=1 Tax=Hexamita inflata TaxID=28002 RepID=A0AA86NUE2_9EUKA|nr:Putative RNA polymerase I specific transcription initiation factor RRN3 family protein [Hexamita inflata]CAI9937426.1 Putative RNA polymerase I specific transcription initiation factor RRN3 family protein [Hexamita inflata]
MELVNEILINPDRLLELNKNCVQNPQLCISWFKAIIQNFQIIADSYEVFINFIQITNGVFRFRLSQPSAFDLIIKDYVQILVMYLSHSEQYKLFVIKQIISSACESGVHQDDVFLVLQRFCEIQPQIKQTIIQAVQLICDGFQSSLELAKLVFDKDFQKYASKFSRDLPPVIKRIVLFNQFFVQLNNLQGVTLNIVQQQINFGVHIDMMKLSLNSQPKQKQVEVENFNNTMNNSMLNSLRAFDEIFHKQIQIHQIDAEDQSGQQLIDNEIYTFLQNHPQILNYLDYCLLQIIDMVIDSSLSILQQQSEQFITNFVPLLFNRLLLVKTRLIQFIVFPLLEIPESQQSLIQILFTTAFANPQVSFDVAQQAANYLMSILARSTSIDPQVLTSIMLVLAQYIFEMDQQVNLKQTHNQASLRFLLAVKCFMYVFVFISNIINLQVLKPVLNHFCQLQNEPQIFFQFILDEFTETVIKNEIIDNQQLDKLIALKLKSEKTQQNVEYLVEFYPFEPIELDLAQRWIQNYRNLDDIDLIM